MARHFFGWSFSWDGSSLRCNLFSTLYYNSFGKMAWGFGLCEDFSKAFDTQTMHEKAATNASSHLRLKAYFTRLFLLSIFPPLLIIKSTSLFPWQQERFKYQNFLMVKMPTANYDGKCDRSAQHVSWMGLERWDAKCVYLLVLGIWWVACIAEAMHQ